MAETHHKPETGMPTTRCYTVGYVSDAKYRPVPAVTLKSHWLKEIGFDTGTALEVKILPGCLILAATGTARRAGGGDHPEAAL